VKWLTGDGLVAALVVGGATAWGLGWRGVVLLFAFFISGSLLTRLAGGEGGQRTAWQVLANGGVAATAAAAGWWPVTVGALAAAAADTWATEIGSFSPHSPRLLTTGTHVPRGTSGGVTLLGSVGGVAGAGFLVGVGWLVEPRTAGPGSGVAMGILAGVAGMMVDSLLGATLQGKFACATCGKTSERRGTLCHGPMARTHGWGWINNDMVNLAATAAGAATAAALS
jgi:uncharacterized protein (TIGR00297 family)